MKRAACIVLTIIMSLSVQFHTFASVDVVYDGSSVILSGSVPDISSDNVITVLVAKPNEAGEEASADDIINAQSSSDYQKILEYIGIVKLTENSEFEQPYKMFLKDDLPSGLCGIYINNIGLNKLSKIGQFNHVNVQELNALVSKFNSVSADYSALLNEDNVELLSNIGILSEEYKLIENEERFNTILKKYAPFEAGKPSKDKSAILNFCDSFNEAIALEQLYEANDTLSVLEKYNGKIWNVAVDEESDFDYFGGAEKNTILSELKSENFNNAEEVSKSFALKAGMIAFKELLNVKGDVEDFISKYADVFGFDISLYNSNSLSAYDRADVCAYILKNKENAGSKDSIVKLYNDALKSIKKEDTSSGIRGGGGGAPTKVKPVTAPTVDASLDNRKTAYIPFGDVPEDYWAYPYIARLYKNKIVSGKGNNVFEPDSSMTKEEFVKIIVEVLNITETSNVTFSDVQSDSWCYPYIARAVTAGLITGKDDGTFGAGNKISRQDVAVIIGRALKLTSENEIACNDASAISDYAKQYVAAVYDEGIMNGYSDRNFRPLNEMSRAECCTMICRILDKRSEQK